MLKKIIVLAGIACCLSCQPRKPEMQPPAAPYFRSLSVKFNYQDRETRQNGRVHWRLDENHSKFLFFTPLNQVGLELDVAGEEAVLVNFSRKTFWRGDFSGLLERMWGIDLTLSELRSLLVEGVVPQAAFTGKGIAVALERNGGSGAPQTVRLRRGATDLTLRISRSEFRSGKIVLIDYSQRYQGAELESVLEDD
jgi:hypothetical protein